jgi:Leucine-rich repeat (LRR) protein
MPGGGRGLASVPCQADVPKMPENSHEGWPKAVLVLGVFSSLTALAVSIAPLYHNLQTLWPMVATVGALALVLLVVVNRGAWSRESELHDPRERLHLWSTQDGPLLQRKDVVYRVFHACQDNPAVLLLGDSGAGKSALVIAGLIPLLAESTTARLAPTMIARYGTDWALGPAMALLRQLQPEHPNCRDLQSRDPSAVVDTLDELIARSSRRPLLIFDQFEDYILSHASMLRTDSGWITSQQLAARNCFWAATQRWLDAGSIHLLFVVREYDQAIASAFLGPSRPKVDETLLPFTADQVKAVVDGVIEPEGEPALIVDPERGWTRLRDALCEDLVKSTALPAEIALCLRALQILRRPTLRHYIDAGRLPGMQVLFLKQAVDRAAAASVLLTPAQVKLLLSLLLAPGLANPLPVSISRSVRELAGSVFAAREVSTAQIGAVESALESLKKDALAKEQLDPATQQKRWRLYSDFLCGVVAALVSIPNPWQTRLDSYAAEYWTALSLWEKSERLLPIRLQLVLFGQRVRRSIRYGAAREYAILSLLKLLLPLLLLVCAAFGIARFDRQRANRDLFRVWKLPPDLVERQDQLTSLSLNGRVSRIDWLHNHLAGLNLGGADIDDGSDGYPAHLRSLDISHTQVTSLRPLPRSLLEINITGVSSLVSLGGVPPRLRVLKAIGTGIADLHELPPTLAELEMGGPQLTSLAKQLPPLPHLVRLTLDHAALATLQGLPAAVRSLTLRMDLLVNPDFRLDQEGPRLDQLTGLSLDAVPGVALAKLPRLLSSLELSGLALESLTGMPDRNLDRLTIKGRIFDPETSQRPGSWNGMPDSLTSLTLIDQPSLPPRFPPHLRALALIGVGDFDLRALRGLTELRSLSLRWNGTTDLRQLPPALTTLEIEGVDVSDLSWVPVSILHLAVRWAPRLVRLDHLPPHLESLDLSGCTHLADLGAVPPTLHSLNIAGTSITALPAGMTTLRELDLRQTLVPNLQNIPPQLGMLRLSPGLRSLRNLPVSVNDLRFVDSPLDAAPPSGRGGTPGRGAS